MLACEITPLAEPLKRLDDRVGAQARLGHERDNLGERGPGFAVSVAAERAVDRPGRSAHCRDVAGVDEVVLKSPEVANGVRVLGGCGRRRGVVANRGETV